MAPKKEVGFRKINPLLLNEEEDDDDDDYNVMNYLYL
jgi:hypothetical protein